MSDHQGPPPDRGKRIREEDSSPEKPRKVYVPTAEERSYAARVMEAVLSSSQADIHQEEDDEDPNEDNEDPNEDEQPRRTSSINSDDAVFHDSVEDPQPTSPKSRSSVQIEATKSALDEINKSIKVSVKTSKAQKERVACLSADIMTYVALLAEELTFTRGELKLAISERDAAKLTTTMSTRVTRTAEDSRPSYSAALQSGRPILHPKERIPEVKRDTQPPSKPVFFFPTDKESPKTSQEILSSLKKNINTKDLGIQILRTSTIRNGGVVVEARDAASAKKLQEAAVSVQGIRAEEKRARLPSVIIYDVPSDLTNEGVLKVIKEENLKDYNNEDLKMIRVNARTTRTGRRNFIVELPQRLREHLLRAGHAFFEWTSCRVADYVQVTRCFKCHLYGHVAKHCKDETYCYRCALKGHDGKDCPNITSVEVCPTCTRFGKTAAAAQHRVGTDACPAFRAALERTVKHTEYA